jgi:hypothetical protein
LEDLEELLGGPHFQAEIVGALAVFTHPLGGRAVQIVEGSTERQAHFELAPAPLDVVGQQRRRGEGGLQVVDRLAVAEALARQRARGGQVAQRARVIAAALEMDRE